jgi:hypothetical protein
MLLHFYSSQIGHSLRFANRKKKRSGKSICSSVSSVSSVSTIRDTTTTATDSHCTNYLFEHTPSTAAAAFAVAHDYQEPLPGDFEPTPLDCLLDTTVFSEELPFPPLLDSDFSVNVNGVYHQTGNTFALDSQPEDVLSPSLLTRETSLLF